MVENVSINACDAAIRSIVCSQKCVDDILTLLVKLIMVVHPDNNNEYIFGKRVHNAKIPCTEWGGGGAMHVSDVATSARVRARRHVVGVHASYTQY
jgi:hypothetical protein